MTVTKIDFDPDKKTIKDIFEGSTRMSIPRYQRTYSWSKDKVQEFYDDFIVDSEKPEDNLSYLGTILFSKDDDGNLEVIDGQQRLVTITIFFAAMRDLLRNVVNTDQARDIANGLQKLIIVESVLGSSILSNRYEDQIKLQVGADIERLFRDMIYKGTDDVGSMDVRKTAEKYVLNAYNLFYENVKSSIDHPGISKNDQLKMVIRLFQKILSIEYIDIRVIDKEVAYNLFESHNAKGVALAKTDLIKNYYFGRLKGTDAEKNKKMDEWDGLLESLNDKTRNMPPDRFFNYMIESYDGSFSSTFLYRKIKPHIQDTGKFYKMLKVNVENMIVLKSASTQNRVVDMSLSGIEKMKVNQCFIYLLCLYRNKDFLNQKSYQEVVKLIENFTYLYSAISKQPTNALEKVYSKHAKKLQEAINELAYQPSVSVVDKERLGGRTLKALRSDFAELMPTLSVFRDGFLSLSYENPSQKSMIQYTFQRIERYNSKDLINFGVEFTLDHINAQSKSKGNKLYQSIGNLVPLSSYDNSALGSSDPHVKFDVYRENSHLYSVADVVEVINKNKEYTETDIHNRADSLTNYVYSEVFVIDK